jgi:uncharacterized protein YgfB (UPF0149 family)
MSMDDRAPSYEQLSAALSAAGVYADSAELHGGICGSLSVGGLAAAHSWTDSWLADAVDSFEHDTDPRKCIDALARATAQSMESGDFGLELVLPDDALPLSERIGALAAWCHGFISALGVTGLQPRELDSERREQVEEIIQDFSEISRANTEEVATNEADFQFYELVEFVRAGTQMTFEMLTAERAGRAPRSLH